jgi:uncharacterized protein
MTYQPPQEFWQGVTEFNQRQFYACHDTLEAVWLEAPDYYKKFYQGILQIAVSCYHLSNKNWRGAVILLGEGINRLSNYSPTELGINIEILIDQSMELLTSLQGIPPEQVGELANYLGLISEENLPQSLFNFPCKLPTITIL